MVLARLSIAVFLFSSLLSGIAPSSLLAAQEIPHLDRAQGSTELIVGGQPFLILGGELGNSSAGTAAQADQILPRLARAHINTVLMPVAWEQLEPVEGSFDFAILDHWIEQARLQHLHLVLLWFGSWKNAFSSYAPEWVKNDPRRFSRRYLPMAVPWRFYPPSPRKSGCRRSRLSRPDAASQRIGRHAADSVDGPGRK